MSKRKLDYPHLTPEEQGAIKRLMADESYRAAVDWLLYKACHIADLSYRPESQRDTDFAEGARFVGLSFVRAAKLPALADSSQPRGSARDGTPELHRPR